MKTWPSFEALEAATEDDWLGDIDAEAQARLLDLRGGCTCCVSPPCWKCVEPITLDEAECLGLIEKPAPTIDYMGAVRALCK